MPSVFPISDVADLAELLREAGEQGRVLEPRGGGDKAAYGGWRSPHDLLDLRRLAGVVDYDPAELILTARPGTPLTEIEAMVAAEGQMLAFEPMDYGPLLGAPAGRATLGGVIASGSAGPRRVSHGGVRDHLLGFSAVSGAGEVFKAGGKVVKNVTGFDLSKLMAGSWGALAVLTEVTLKIVPAGRETATLALRGLTEETGVAAMTAALGSSAEVSGAAHLPAGIVGPEAVTALRLEGFGPSVAARTNQLRTVLAAFGRCDPLPDTGAPLWRDLRQGRFLLGDGPLWRAILPPANGARFAAELAQRGASCILDWGGGLAWVPGSDDDHLEPVVRAAAARCDGHAVLVRPGVEGSAASAYPPQSPGVAGLSARVKRAFDPRGVLADRRASAGAA